VTSATLIEKCCLIAHPVAGNPTHYIVEHALTQQGLDWRFMTFEVDPERLGDAMRGVRALGFHGVKIGEPFHETVLGHVDELTDRAKRAGSVNSLTADGERLVGDNTEGAALVELAREHVKLSGQRAMVIGAGRLARVIATALIDAGAAVTIASRSSEAGQRLVETIQLETAATPTLVLLEAKPIAIATDVGLVVNATSLGMAEPSARLPIDTASLTSQMVVADVAYSTSHTWLTRQAEERGCRVIDGLALYVEQTALALAEWTGARPDKAAMRETAEEFLGI
jgi:shikimate dehydrogenase